MHDNVITHFGDSVIHPPYFAAKISGLLWWRARFLGETIQSILPIRELVYPEYLHQPCRRRLRPKKGCSQIFFLPLFSRDAEPWKPPYQPKKQGRSTVTDERRI
jgi:hypothetical protein